MTKNPKAKWGGYRPRPPGKEGGRPKNKLPTRLLKLQMTDEEWRQFLKILPKRTRERARHLLELLKIKATKE